MGYTHYLTTDKKLTKTESRKAALACARFLISALEKLPPDTLEEPSEEMEMALWDCLQKKDAETLADLWLGYKMIIVPVRNSETLGIPLDKKFCFCKTGSPGTPSDTLVMSMFLAMQEATSISHKWVFTSDGSPNDLREGFLFYGSVSGKVPVLDIESYLDSFYQEYQDDFLDELQRMEAQGIVEISSPTRNTEENISTDRAKVHVFTPRLH